MSDYAQLELSQDHRGSPPEITLRPVLTILWAYRSVIGLSLAVIVVLSTLVMTYLVVALPVERSAQIGFRVMFDGAEQGTYPNR